ncbi:hypothetical protein BJX63DRAFT_405852, partial [Aspergillus granulosus]
MLSQIKANGLDCRCGHPMAKHKNYGTHYLLIISGCLISLLFRGRITFRTIKQTTGAYHKAT